MRQVAEIVGILIGIFISIKIGWPAPAFFVALIFFMCSLRMFSFTKSPTFNTRLFFSLGVFSLAALLVAWLLNELLASIMANDPALLTRSGVTAFLLGTNPLRSFWIVIAALLIALILGSVFVVPTAIANGRMTYGAHNQYQGQKPQATVSAAKDIVGINKGIWVVNNGTSRIIADQTESLEALGGPATLIVQDGNAVILEKVGQFSRVVGSGLTQLAPYERVAMVVPLTLRSEHLNIANVATADRILIENFELWAFHRVLVPDPTVSAANAPSAATSPPPPAPEADGIEAAATASAPPPAPNLASNGSVPAPAIPPSPASNPQGRFPFDPDILITRVWTMSGNDWRDSVRNVVETATRDVVGRHTLEEILPLADANRWAFREELMAAVNRVTANLMGVNVTAVDFGEVRVPAEVRESLQARQVAGWKADTAEREEREAAGPGACGGRASAVIGSRTRRRAARHDAGYF